MRITRYGTCPGIRSGENEVAAWDRQTAYYGDQRVHRVFFPYTLMGAENGSAQAARTLVLNRISPSEDLVVSCKDVGPEFPARVEELKQARQTDAVALGLVPGITRIIVHHEPEGDLTVAAYNAKWDTALPTLEAEAAWLEPGTCHTAFWSRKVDAAGVRLNDWRQWIPASTSVQALLRFVSFDLYPGAGRPTKSKPNYYEPPSVHPSPYGAWEEIGFCGVLDEALAELRGPAWPNVREDLEGGIAETNHSRPTVADGWPSSFTDTDGSDCAAWLDSVLAYARDRYAFVTYFHKSGGDLMARTPTAEAQVLRDWIRNTYAQEPPEPPAETVEQAYARGVADGTAAERARVFQLLDAPLTAHQVAVQQLSESLGPLGDAVESLAPSEG